MARSISAVVEPLGHKAVALRDRFPTDISDADYFHELGKEGDWVVISKDLNNAKRTPERRAILSSGVIALYLAKGVQKLPITQQTASILWQWDKIVSQRNNNANGLFQLPLNKGAKFRSL